ncbi:hypothetical protein EON80_18560 [bacterium]|nr:MAG: hypothetical protein EON80_18560 [bacterium]
MKTTKAQGILLGLGVLGATGFLSTVQPAQAAPTFEVLTGRVIKNYVGNGFMMITDRGSTYTCTVNRGEPRRLSVGDRIQISGVYRHGAFRAQSFRMLRDR